jgi:hypothetical protein
MCFTVNGEMQLTPDTAAFLAMLFDFPLSPSPKTFSPVESITGVRFHPGWAF